MMDVLGAGDKKTHGADVVSSIRSRIVESFTEQSGSEAFLRDLAQARREINIDIPGETSVSSAWLQKQSDTLQDAKKRGLRVFVRTDNKTAVPKEIKPLVIGHKFIANPVVLIDRSIVWYGMPISEASFISEGKTIPTRIKPILRFRGKHFAQSLFGFLEMNQTVDSSDEQIEIGDDSTYSTFASYVAGEIKCSSCGAKMRLRKNRRGGFFLSCENYPKCENTQFVEPSIVKNYLYFNNKSGKLCPQDNTSLEPKLGKFGVYVCCNALKKHTFRLDEI
jgi:hypothetical protein